MSTLQNTNYRLKELFLNFQYRHKKIQTILTLKESRIKLLLKELRIKLMTRKDLL